MKTPPDENQIFRWLDGEMTAAEKSAFEAHLATDPALKAELDSMCQLGETLRQNLPVERPLPHADFFNSQIQVRIAQEELDLKREVQRPATAASWFSWLRMPRLAFAAALLVLGIALTFWQPGSGLSTTVVSSYAPNPVVQARAFHSEEANATVIMLDGLDSLPADRKIVGHHVHRTESDTAVATTTLFSESGEILLVLAKGADSHPQMIQRTPRS